jgi:hypothetical protein
MLQLPFIFSATFFVVFALPTMTLFVLGIFHKLFGLRQKYKDLLLFIFERGRQRIEKNALTRRQSQLHLGGDDEQDGDNEPILYNEREGPSPDFELSDTFELITAGIQAIVKDQVTQRFVFYNFSI